MNRHRAARRVPTAREHFFWMVISLVSVMAAVVAVAVVTQDADAQPSVFQRYAPLVTLAAPLAPLNVGQLEHSAFPGLAKMPDGSLHLVWRQGSDHYLARDGDLMRAVSTDSGTTYHDVTVLRTGADFRDPNISYANGAAHMTMFTGTAALAAQGAYTVREWGLYSRIDTLPYAAVTAPIVQLPDGRLGAAFYGRKAGEVIDTAWMGWSSDGGKTWSTNRIVNSIGAGVHHNEPWLVVDGSQIHFFYRHGSADGIGLRTSPDSGVTWGPPRKILENASGRPTVLRTSTVTLVVVYRALPSKDAALAYSTDGGATWQSGGTVLAAPAGSPLGMTYAAMAETSPGTVHVVVGMEEADGTSRLWGGWLTG